MTKTELDDLIDWLDERIRKAKFDAENVHIHCTVKELYDLIRSYPGLPVDKAKTCGPDYEAECKWLKEELDRAQRNLESIKFDMHNLSIEHAQYAGAVAAIETLFGRKFEPQR